MFEKISHGCDLVFFRKNRNPPLIYTRTSFAYRPTYNMIAVKLENETTVLIRATGGSKYQLVDEWQYIGEKDEYEKNGKYYSYTCRSINSSPTNGKRKDPITGKLMWERVKTHKIID